MNSVNAAVADGEGVMGRRRRMGVLALALAALALAAALAPGAAKGAGGGIQAPGVVQIAITYAGACTPGTIGAAIQGTQLIDASHTQDISVSGSVAGCIGTATSPGTVMIGNELFDYANISTTTTAGVVAGSPTEGILGVQSTSGFPLSGQVFVGSELLSYDNTSMPSTSSLNITSASTYAQTHPIGTFVRLQGKLRLVGRGQPTSNPGAGVGATAQVFHNSGSPIRGPDTHLTCRGMLPAQTKVAGGDDIISMRYRCYMRLEPDSAWTDVTYTAPPDDPSTGPVLALTPVLYHGTAAGMIDDDGTGQMVLTTEVFGLTCFPFVQGQLWIKATEVVNPSAPDTFTMYAYADDRCTELAFTLGGDPGNLTFTSLPDTTDTDKDGCTDGRELGDVKPFGGLRDPFNPFDYFDINGDGAISVGVDILQVAGAFGNGNPRYVDYKERGLKAPDPLRPPGNQTNDYIDGPSSWNKKGPNGSIDIGGDILGVAGQFGDACPHDPGVTSMPYGAQPAKTTASVSAGQSVPFDLAVAATPGTAGFPSSGTILVDAETLTYTSKTATSFHITARGNGMAGNDPAAHGSNATVYQKRFTRLTAGVTAGQPLPFDMAVESTFVFPASGTIQVDAETLTYTSKTATAFHVTARAAPAQHGAYAVVYPTTP